MVRTSWTGRLGNRMFQHVCSGIISKYSNTQLEDVQLSTKFWHYDHDDFNEFFKLNESVLGKEPGEGSEIIIDDGWVQSNYKKISELKPGNYLCNGYYQSSVFLNYFKHDVLNFYQPLKPIQNIGGALVHLRFGELEGVDSGTLEYYDKALTAAQVTEGCIATMPELKDHAHVKQLQSKYNLTFLDKTPATLLHLARGFNTVVVGTGSFAWWLAFMSKASSVYYYDVPEGSRWHGDMFTDMGWNALR
jgi:hypothetical protein